MSKGDGDQIALLLKNCGFEVHHLHDQPLRSIEREFHQLLQDAEAMARLSSSDLFFVYYSGHGFMQTQTCGVTIAGETIHIESFIYHLSYCPNTYTIAVLDCEREFLNK